MFFSRTCRPNKSNRIKMVGSFVRIVVLLVVAIGVLPTRPTFSEEELEQPLPLHVGEMPSRYSPLVYPDETPVGYATSGPGKPAASPSPRRYVETPEPEDVPNSPMIRVAVGGTDEGQTVLVSDLVPAPRLAMPESVVSNPQSSTPGPKPVADSKPSVGREVDPYHPPVRTAAFLKVVPGETSQAELIEFWGEPVKRTQQDTQTVFLYSTEILNHIEVFCRDRLVGSIVVRLDEPFPEEQVRDVLQSELLKSKPVLIPDETGRIIGEVFPEKGVLFLFSSSENEKVYMVNQIAIEPVTSEPFVLRAEATLANRPSEARRDLQDAVRLNPKDAKAFWLLAQIELMQGRAEAALFYAEKAIQLNERRPAYHLALGEALARMNRIEEAKLYLEETLGLCDRFPHEKARALTKIGDLYRTGPQPDCETAIDFHSDAIRLASSLTDHANPTIRQTAKDVLFDAHLGAARDVAWGQWDDKETSIEKWITQAKEIADDPEMISAKRFSMDYPLKIAVCRLACQVGLPDDRNIETLIRDVMKTGELLVQSTDDPILIGKYQWETSLSLYDAVQIYQLRKQYSLALKYGEIAATYMEFGLQGRTSDTDSYLLGRLYFRLGAIHAIGNKNHRAAIEWFDRSKPVIEKLLPKINPEELGRIGETLVSMGVSYWMTGQREEAVRLTERGLKQIERGVSLGLLDNSAFSIPYSNLASMHRELGNQENARRYAQLAETIR